MAFKDNYEFELLINEAETLVIDELEKELAEIDDEDICKCQVCVLDMAALALNNIKPVYRSSFTGRMYAQALLEGEFKSSIKHAVKSALEKVSKNPSHELR